jgi:hypothetical protein
MTLEILKAARERIRDPKHWTTKAMARDANGKHIAHPMSHRPIEWHNAVCWCGTGAIHMEADQRHERPWGAVLALEDAAFRLFNLATISVNDILGHEAIMRVFDDAIEAQERTTQP